MESRACSALFFFGYLTFCHFIGGECMNRITKFEWQILCLFLGAAAVNCSFFHMKLLTMTSFYLLGILFEFITEPLWTYNSQLHQSPLTLKSMDINFLFGFGWVAIVILSLSLGNVLDRWIPVPLISGIIGFLLVGNVMESLYFYFGLWTYATGHPMLRFPPLVGRYVEVAKIPLSVRLGYAVTGIVAFYCNKLLSTIFQ
jgi:hypothetical protein